MDCEPLTPVVYIPPLGGSFGFPHFLKEMTMPRHILRRFLLGLLALGFAFVSAQPETPEDIARTYLKARNAYDIEATKALLTDNAALTELGEEWSVEDLASFLDYAAATDFQWDVEKCETVTEAEVSCSTLTSNAISRALDIEPVSGGIFHFSISDGKISDVNHEFDLSFWEPNVWRAFIAFVRANHAEDFDKLFSERGLIGISDEGLTLWESHASEFAEVMEAARANPPTPAEEIGWAFLDARGKWDGPAIGALLGDVYESYDVQNASTPEDYAKLVSWYESLNWNWTPVSCDEIGTAGGTAKVYCTSELENDWTRGTGDEPYIMGWGLELQKDKIVGIYPEWNRFFIQKHFFGFRDYVEQNHHADYEVMFLDGFPNIEGGEEAFSLYTKHTETYLVQQSE